VYVLTYRELGDLGSGEFGIITHGKWLSHKEVEIAIKTLNPSASDKTG